MELTSLDQIERVFLLKDYCIRIPKLLEMRESYPASAQACTDEIKLICTRMNDIAQGLTKSFTCA